MSRILVTNGDHAAHALAAHFPDAEILIWRDVLVEGPVPGGVDDEALADVRAQHIENAFGMNDVRADFTRRNKAFEKIGDFGRVELWFETDLHDQLQIIELLARLSKNKPAASPYLALAAPPLPNHIDLAAQRMREISGDDYEAAATMWSAFRAPAPGAVREHAFTTGALPEVRTCFARLLEEYPSPRDGLGRVERAALLAIRDGAITPGLAFRHYRQTEPLPFLGDLGFYYRLEKLGLGASPLVHGLPEGGVAKAARSNMAVEYTHTPVELTEAGHAILEGRADHVKLNGIDRWIGGMHLTNENVWRYDTQTKSLMRG
ncbi:MAG: hypothetical protein IPK23_13545 [Rhizobiales bacterium]|nr:hypothetical protein [Hyphomicrobiales bacterium]